MYKCNVCGHTQEEAGEHCHQPMVMVEEGAASGQPAASDTPSEPSSGEQNQEGGQQ